jgi:hypothetical protein
LTECFTEELDSLNRSKGQRCPGEGECDKLQKRGLRKREKIESFCSGCVMFGTKPGRRPESLGLLIDTALRLDELRQAGAVFHYPDALCPEEWQGLIALNRARHEAERREMIRREEEQRKNRNRWPA